MKREIKFRAWDNHLEVMHYDIQLLDTFNEYLSKDKFNCLQYTGLKDKNGKEIYEGDVIRGFNNINKYTDPRLAPNIEPTYTDGKFVEFMDGGFVLSSKKYPNGGCGSLQTYRPNRSEFIEIIGNIHENPELL